MMPTKRIRRKKEREEEGERRGEEGRDTLANKMMDSLRLKSKETKNRTAELQLVNTSTTLVECS